MALSAHAFIGPVNVVGLMSGTSLDGVDAALLCTDGEQVLAHGPSLTQLYPPELRASLRDLLDRAPMLAPDDPELLVATHALSRLHAEAVLQLCRRAPDMPPELVGFHGQTILHAPASLATGQAGAGRTWQIGDAALLSAMTDLPVIHDFRSADVRAGGEGAPLAPLYHAALLAGQPRPVAVLNLAGWPILLLCGAMALYWPAIPGPAMHCWMTGLCATPGGHLIRMVRWPARGGWIAPCWTPCWPTRFLPGQPPNRSIGSAFTPCWPCLMGWERRMEPRPLRL